MSQEYYTIQEYAQSLINKGYRVYYFPDETKPSNKIGYDYGNLVNFSDLLGINHAWRVKKIKTQQA